MERNTVRIKYDGKTMSTVCFKLTWVATNTSSWHDKKTSLVMPKQSNLIHSLFLCQVIFVCNLTSMGRHAPESSSLPATAVDVVTNSIIAGLLQLLRYHVRSAILLCVTQACCYPVLCCKTIEKHVMWSRLFENACLTRNRSPKQHALRSDSTVPDLPLWCFETSKHVMVATGKPFYSSQLS